MTLIDKLREATQPMHEELDAAMTPYIKSIRSTEDYLQLLVAFYGFFQPVYQKIDTHLQTAYLPDYTSRRKPADIMNNLLLLQYYQPVTDTCRQLPSIYNNASAFGALYVMEGSTLGGLMIKKMLAEQTGLKEEQLSFFAGYGKQTREKWNVFIDTLNSVAKEETEERQTITAAGETFVCFASWLKTLSFYK